jgi:hypothetical protein
MNTETDTPRTDEWLAEEKRNPRLSGLGNWLDYCKLLERELNAVTEQRDRLAEALRDIMTFDFSDGQCDSGYSPIYVAIKALAAVEGGSDE